MCQKAGAGVALCSWPASKVFPNNFSLSLSFFPLGILDSKKIHCQPFFFSNYKTHFDNAQLLNRMIFTPLHMNHSCELYIYQLKCILTSYKIRIKF